MFNLFFLLNNDETISTSQSLNETFVLLFYAQYLSFCNRTPKSF